MPSEAPQLDPQTAQDLAQLARDLAHNPETRREFGKLVKKAKPQSQHANAFADVEIEDKFETFRQEQADKEIKRQQQAVLDRMNAQRAQLLTGGADGTGPKYSEEDVGKIEALMQKKGITDYEDARVLYAATLPPENTRPERELPQHGTTWEFPEWATFSKDPVKASRTVAGQVIGEFMRKRA
jgi:hypothetical protein